MSRMLGPYEIPHACELQELAGVLAQLTRNQRQVLRSYIWQVELGDRTVTAWLAGEKCPVSTNTWYRTGKRSGYYHNEAFQEAITAYKQAGQRWLLSEEERSVAAATRKLRLGAVRAAERMVDLVDNAGSDMVKLRAAEQVLDRADAATAAKVPAGLNVTELSDDELIAIASRGNSGSGGGERAAPA